MSAEKYDLMNMPVVQTLQMIIDGLVVGDEAAGILRDATAALQFVEESINNRRALIARAEQTIVYGKDGKPGCGSAMAGATLGASISKSIQ